MDDEGFRATVDHEEQHWWFRSRRELIAAQLAHAAAELGRRTIRSLDFGCGTGRNLRLLEALGEAWGTDLEVDRWHVGPDDPWRIPLAELARQRGTFDLVTAFDVLEHLDDDVAGLVMLRELLARKDGQLLLTVPAHPLLWSDEDLVSHHRRRYTKRTLLAAATAAGLRVRFVSHFNLCVLPLQALVSWAGRLRRALSPAAAPRTHVVAAPPLLNELAYRLTSLEARAVGTERWASPAGGSLVCRLGVA